MPIDAMSQNHENPLTYEEWSCQYPEYSAALLQSARNSADILGLACEFIQAILFITIWIQATKREFGWGRQDFRCGMKSKL